MKPFIVTPITKDLVVQFSGKEVILPQEIQKKINVYWDELIASGKSYQRGEVFTVTQKDVTDDTINILVEKTDYAHYLYCQNVDDLREDGVHIIHTAVLVESSDGYTIFGEMGRQTSRAGIYQLCGGGIDNDDLKGDYFDFTHNISKELKEELDIDVTNKSHVAYFDESYFKEGGPTDKMTVIYKVILTETRNAFMAQYEQFVERLGERNELPEFGQLIALKNKSDEILHFLEQEGHVFDEYMKPLFAYIEQEK